MHTLDIAKALIDRGFHPPTIYFPLIVPEAIMIEPTETESKETLDAFAAAMNEIAALADIGSRGAAPGAREGPHGPARRGAGGPAAGAPLAAGKGRGVAQPRN